MQALAVLRVVGVGFGRLRRRGDVLRPAAPRPADGRYAVVEPHGAQVRILTRLQQHAAAAEVRVLAHFPTAALHDGRRCAIVEVRPVEIRDRRIHRERLPAQTGLRVQRDLRRCLHGAQDESCAQRSVDERFHRSPLMKGNTPIANGRAFHAVDMAAAKRRGSTDARKRVFRHRPRAAAAARAGPPPAFPRGSPRVRRAAQRRPRTPVATSRRTRTSGRRASIPEIRSAAPA